MDELKIQKELRKFASDRDWEQFHTLKNLAISISLESSELLEIFQWEKDKFDSLQEKKLNMIKDEFADVMLYLLRFADIANLNIEKVCYEKIEKNKKKYPINLARGTSKKYTEL
tara:strand:+ start:1363 stop:1704 length:342 start_codon:yes stop_codon:yes gene_type:complete